jgi:hypothetical protein
MKLTVILIYEEVWHLDHTSDLCNVCRHGKGIFTSVDGLKYAGDWLQGKEEGQGMFPAVPKHNKHNLKTTPE